MAGVICVERTDFHWAALVRSLVEQSIVAWEILIWKKGLINCVPGFFFYYSRIQGILFAFYLCFIVLLCSVCIIDFIWTNYIICNLNRFFVRDENAGIIYTVTLQCCGLSMLRFQRYIYFYDNNTTEYGEWMKTLCNEKQRSFMFIEFFITRAQLVSVRKILEMQSVRNFYHGT